MLKPSIARMAAAALAPLICALLWMPAQAATRSHSHGHDLILFGQDSGQINENEELPGDAVVIGGRLRVLGKIDGDLVIFGGVVFLGPKSEIDGSYVNFGGSVTDQRPAAQRHEGVIPRTSSTPQPPETPEPSATPEPNVTTITIDHEDHSDFLDQLWFIISVTLLSMVAFVLFPGGTRKLNERLVEHPIFAALLGFTWPFIFTIVAVVLVITIIGIVLLPVEFIAFWVAYLIGRAAIALYLGRRAFELARSLEPNPLISVAVGLLLIAVVEALLPPPLGFLCELFITGSLAVGSALLLLFRRTPEAAPELPQKSGPPATL